MLSGFSVAFFHPSSDLPSKMVTNPSASGVLSAATAGVIRNMDNNANVAQLRMAELQRIQMVLSYSRSLAANFRSVNRPAGQGRGAKRCEPFLWPLVNVPNVTQG